MEPWGEEDPRLAQLAELIAATPHNLVSARERDPQRLRELHLAEAWRIGDVLRCAPGEQWLDLGTGGGIPGLVLAGRFPSTNWVLADSVEKKLRAVERFASHLSLHNVRVVLGRAEVLGHESLHREAFQGVVARALAPLVVLTELARGFVPCGGMLAAVKGPGWATELDDARFALQQLGWGDVHSTAVPGVARESWVVMMRANGPAPVGFPRRTGVPARRPLRPAPLGE